ncbi:hypothetical protein BGP75_15800 [Motiliproteus sp. MSK22-1]|nr:hypothetical protein BGP75_15800 [Motiliproteus sp. MSK22-1]
MLGSLTALCLPVSPVIFAADANEPMLWNCVSVDDGQQWECGASEQKTDQSQPAEKSRVDPDQTIPASAIEAKTEKQEISTSRSESSATTQQNMDKVAPESTTKPAASETVQTGTGGPSPIPSFSDSEQKLPHRNGPEFATTSRSVSAYECQAAGDQWECQSNVVQANRQWADNENLQDEQNIYAAPGNYAYLDWYAFADGPDPSTHCTGAYIEPAQLFSEEELIGKEQPIYVKADKTRTQGGNMSTLEGSVYLRKGNSQIRGEVAHLDHENERAELQGSVQFRQPGTLILGNKAIFDQAQGQTILEDAQFVLQKRHLRGSAARVVQHDNGDTYITEGQYTRCEPGNDSWTLNGGEIVLYKNEGYGVAKNATLEISGVPIVYLPYIHFPIDDRRKSGFLTPSIGHSNDNGFDLAAPYYFDLAPHYDLTLTPRYIENRGLMLENEFRYLHDVGQFDLNLALLPGDELRNNEDRWLLGIDHNGSPAEKWRSTIDFTAVSDNDYFDELDTSLNISKDTHLDQVAALSYDAGDWRFDSKIQSYQTVDEAASKPYQKLPQLRFSGQKSIEGSIFELNNTDSDSGNSSRFLDNDIDLNYFADYTQFERDSSAFTGNDATTGGRAHFDASIGTEYNWPWAYVRPKLRLTHTAYQLSNQPAGNEESPSRTLPLFSVDSGFYLDRDTDYKGKTYTHTLEPRIYYLYVPNKDQTGLPDFDSSELTFSYNQLFRDNRFSGLDRIGDTNQLTLGLTTRFLEDNGQELFHASVGQIFYFEDREVRLSSSDPILTDSTSDIAAEAVWRVSKDLRFTVDGEWDQDDLDNTQRNVKLSYRSDVDHQFNFNYRFTRDSIEQTDISFMWPINARWSILGRWLNDFENSESLDKILGLEYENCCWRIRTVYRSWIDDDTSDRNNNGVFLQFTLKGLGTFGTRAAGDSGPKAKNFLEDISGFEERENHE